MIYIPPTCVSLRSRWRIVPHGRYRGVVHVRWRPCERGFVGFILIQRNDDMIPGVEYHRSFGMAAESIAMPRQSGVYPISLPKSGIDVIIEADRKSQPLFRSEWLRIPSMGGPHLKNLKTRFKKPRRSNPILWDENFRETI